MEMIKNIITAIGCDLRTRGAQTFCGVMDSLTKKDRKKSGHYLVVPNDCVLSLSLSLSEKTEINLFLLLSYARAERRITPCRQRTYSKFSLSFLCL